jgi:hypothetical protein
MKKWNIWREIWRDAAAAREKKPRPSHRGGKKEDRGNESVE